MLQTRLLSMTQYNVVEVPEWSKVGASSGSPRDPHFTFTIDTKVVTVEPALSECRKGGDQTRDFPEAPRATTFDPL